MSQMEGGKKTFPRSPSGMTGGVVRGAHQTSVARWEQPRPNANRAFKPIDPHLSTRSASDDHHRHDDRQAQRDDLCHRGDPTTRRSGSQRDQVLPRRRALEARPHDLDHLDRESGLQSSHRLAHRELRRLLRGLLRGLPVLRQTSRRGARGLDPAHRELRWLLRGMLRGMPVLRQKSRRGARGLDLAHRELRWLRGMLWGMRVLRATSRRGARVLDPDPAHAPREVRGGIRDGAQAQARPSARDGRWRPRRQDRGPLQEGVQALVLEEG